MVLGTSKYRDNTDFLDNASKSVFIIEILLQSSLNLAVGMDPEIEVRDIGEGLGDRVHKVYQFGELENRDGGSLFACDIADTGALHDQDREEVSIGNVKTKPIKRLG